MLVVQLQVTLTYIKNNVSYCVSVHLNHIPGKEGVVRLFNKGCLQ
jgi:hypothetical protein